MTRVCCVHGIWQFIAVVAGLRQAALEPGGQTTNEDILVLYGAAEKPVWVEQLTRLSSKLWPWKAVVWAGDLLVQRPAGDLEPLFQQIRERIGAENADEVWIWTLNGQSQKLVAEAYPKAHLALYEDGLHSYVMHQPGTKPGGKASPGLSDRVRLLRRSLVDDRDVRRRVMLYHTFGTHLNRVSTMYLYLAHDLPLQAPYSKLPMTLIKDEVMQGVLADMAAALGVTVQTATEGMEKRALVLGQCFAKIDAMTEEAELELYRGIVGRLLSSGYTIYWKDHPRVEGLYYSRLRDLFPGAPIQKVELPPGIPVELAAKGLGLSLCVAATSSSLFYLRRLYGIETYTMAQEILPFVKGDLALMTHLTMEKVPSYSTLTG
jgi:hypothetical protein